ncbi:hypothetical protein MTO96_038239 [Rhipicephalus appendiculatus]
MDDVASTSGQHNVPCLPASQAEKQTLVGGDPLAASFIPVTRLDKQPGVKVVGGDNIDPAALRLPELSESSFSLGVESSIEPSPSLDECDVEVVAPREAKRAYMAGTSSVGTQGSRSESQQPNNLRPSFRGPKCGV